MNKHYWYAFYFCWFINVFFLHALPDVTCIILGATGDLTRRDLIPALYQLYKNKELTNFAVVGAATSKKEAADILHAARPFIHNLDEALWSAFSEHMYYIDLDFNSNDFDRLQKAVVDVEQKHALSGNRLVYCSCSPHFFKTITQKLIASKVIEKQDSSITQSWHRIAYEKPFGYDLQDACALEQTIELHLNEQQIIRIDHFLMHQTMGYMLSFRFVSQLFESRWNNEHIASVDILFNETLSIGTRGYFYDKVGALLDVVQNHMFQMFALMAMEQPVSLITKNIQDAKVALLQQTKVIDGFFGQYVGYHQELHIPSDSTTDTFVALQLAVDNERWRGVPFFLVGGKCLDKTEICMRIHFKSGDELTLWLAPMPGFELKMGLTRVAIDDHITPIIFRHTYVCEGSYSVQTYRTIMEQLIKGNNAVSVRFDEIEAAWRLIDQIKAQSLPLFSYEKGSKGPSALEEFIQR